MTGLPILASGTSGNPATPTYTAISLASFIPPTAAKYRAFLSAQPNSAQCIAAPNPNYGPYGSGTTSPPPLQVSGGSNPTLVTVMGEFVVEGVLDFYYASNTSTGFCGIMGYTDNL